MSTSGFFDPVAARRYGAIKTWEDFDESYFEPTVAHFEPKVAQFAFGATSKKAQKRKARMLDDFPLIEIPDNNSIMINELHETIKAKDKLIADQATLINHLQSEIDYMNQSKYDYDEIAQKNKPITREIKKLSKFFKF